jgi:hypothetical protein
MKCSITLHPFLFAAYPILFLISNNIGQIAFEQMIRPMIIALVMALLFTVLFSLAAKNLEQGALSASIILILFFSYGHVHILLEKGLPWLSHHAILGSLWILLLAFGLWIKWKIRDLKTTTLTLNIISVALVLIPTFSLVPVMLQPTSVERAQPLPAPQNPPLTSSELPDIYYIILDGYARSDVLEEIYQVDNNAFINFLEESGFYVAKNSQTNYLQTVFSLSSTLNLEYINYLTDELGPSNQNLDPAIDLLKDSQVRRFLEENGYETVAFQTGSGMTMLTDVDYYIPFQPSIVSELEYLLLTSSATRVMETYLENLYNPFTCLGQHESILHIFEKLSEIPNRPGQKFVFVHIMSPHPPFVFGEDGSLVVSGTCNGLDGNRFEGSRQEYKTGYATQITYITRLVQETIETILESSEKAPIIILQSDHGSGLLTNFDSIHETCFYERAAILNAYYLPGYNGDELFDSITPVNSFRIIFNYYFGENFPILEGKSYFSPRSAPYKFVEITDQIEPACIP